MDTSNLEGELEVARERLQRASTALAPKYKGGELEEYRSARASVLSLERQLAAARNQEYLEPLDFPVKWDVGAPMPHLLVNTWNTFLVFYVRVDDPNWDGSRIRIRNPASDSAETLAVAEFFECASVKLGDPNDEVLHGHPLADRGLEAYTAQIVRNSRWLAELEAMNKVHAGYKPEFWRSLNHYIFWFHDETFECVAKSYEVTVLHSTLPEVLEQLTKRLAASEL